MIYLVRVRYSHSDSGNLAAVEASEGATLESIAREAVEHYAAGDVGSVTVELVTRTGKPTTFRPAIAMERQA